MRLMRSMVLGDAIACCGDDVGASGPLAIIFCNVPFLKPEHMNYMLKMASCAKNIYFFKKCNPGVFGMLKY